tara:strand:- start:134 stop:727 length:594 start_codon:yes stop_codon:yes gene_type:complete
MNLNKFIWLLVFPIAFTSCEEDPISGCMDLLALNYNADAVEEANCNYISGCMDILALNYNADAVESGDCTYDAAIVLQENNWLIQSVTGNLGDTEIDLLLLTDLIPLCTHDNIFVFHADNSVSMEDNMDLCEEGEESILDLSGTWVVDGSVLTIENGTDVYVLTISNLTYSSMDLLFDYAFNDIIDIPATIVLVANE